MDAKEIYQAVLADCTAQIDRIKNEYGEVLAATICNRLSQQYSSRVDNLEKQNRELEKRLEKLEAEVKRNSNVSNTKSGVSNASVTSKSNDRVKIDYAFQISAYEYNGWFYYANKKMGEFLYRVRTDGTGNEQLTDYSVTLYDAKIKNGSLFFKDGDFNVHSIKV